MNLGNILDESPEQCDHLLLNSPILNNAEWQALIDHLGSKAAVIDCTFDADNDNLKEALDRIQMEAENAVRVADVSTSC